MAKYRINISVHFKDLWDVVEVQADNKVEARQKAVDGLVNGEFEAQLNKLYKKHGVTPKQLDWINTSEAELI